MSTTTTLADKKRKNLYTLLHNNHRKLHLCQIVFEPIDSKYINTKKDVTVVASISTTLFNRFSTFVLVADPTTVQHLKLNELDNFCKCIPMLYSIYDFKPFAPFNTEREDGDVYYALLRYQLITEQPTPTSEFKYSDVTYCDPDNNNSIFTVRTFWKHKILHFIRPCINNNLPALEISS